MCKVGDSVKLGKFKFEKLNMKLVVAIGVSIIVILTVLFIIFRTNLIVNHKKNNDTNSSTTSNTASNTDSNTNEDPSNTDTDSNTNTNTSSNTNYEDPDEPKEEQTVSEEAKNRTKPSEKLNLKEKKYIIEENLDKIVEADKKNLAKECSTKDSCVAYAENNLVYGKDEKVGYTVGNCSGKIFINYDKKKDDFTYDLDAVKCK